MDSATTSDGRHAAKMERAHAFNILHGSATSFEIVQAKLDREASALVGGWLRLDTAETSE